MEYKQNSFPKYAGEVIRNRLSELGLSQYRFLRSASTTTQPTLTRLLRGSLGSNINTLAEVCDALGLEITIKPKKDGIDYKKKFSN